MELHSSVWQGLRNKVRQAHTAGIYLFYAGLTIELLMVIVDKSNYINPIEGRLFQITFLLFALKLL